MVDLTKYFAEEDRQESYTQQLGQLCPEVWDRFFFNGTALAEKIQVTIDVLRKSERDDVWVLGNLAEIGMIYVMKSYVPS